MATGNRALHREGGCQLYGVANPPLREVLVQEERSLERGRRTLERLAEHRDENASAVELAERIAQPLRPGERVILIAALRKARRGRQVVVRAHRHDQEVGVVRPDVGRHPARGRVDSHHGLPAKLDGVLGDVAVGQTHSVGRLAAEHHLELRKAEIERVVAVDERDADGVRGRLGEARG